MRGGDGEFKRLVVDRLIGVGAHRAVRQQRRQDGGNGRQRSGGNLPVAGLPRSGGINLLGCHARFLCVCGSVDSGRRRRIDTVEQDHAVFRALEPVRSCRLVGGAVIPGARGLHIGKAQDHAALDRRAFQHFEIVIERQRRQVVPFARGWSFLGVGVKFAGVEGAFSQENHISGHVQTPHRRESRALAASADEAGFWPVTSRPSVCTCEAQSAPWL
ncbi:Uncharacterised protein [Klebsiella pneumoniae]|nr:Uncharacterised protein [Klebsiella pneumoniae]